MSDSRKLIADALLEIVEQAQSGGPVVRVGLMAHGSELGDDELLRGAMIAQERNPGLKVVAIGPKQGCWAGLEWIDTPACEADIAAALEKALADGVVGGAVALHYPFPVGVTTIGRIVTPGKGKPMFIASTTGTSSPHRNEAMLRNAVYGNAVAKAMGIVEPSVAVLNIDGAGPVLRALGKLKDAGYGISFGASERKDGGSLLRGNDIVAGGADVLVCDTLTGNVLIKVFSTFTTGGFYESTGFGYGPSVGDGWGKVVSIISRSSGAPVIADALGYTARAVKGELPKVMAAELAAAKAAGFDKLCEDLRPKAVCDDTPVKPPVVPVDAEIAGVDVLDMERAAQALWKEGIYAETAMGCTGPVVRVQASVKDKAAGILHAAGFI
jgi:hypothetical protein